MGKRLLKVSLDSFVRSFSFVLVRSRPFSSVLVRSRPFSSVLVRSRGIRMYKHRFV